MEKKDKLFCIKRFSYLSDEYDYGIAAKEIEHMLNNSEVGHLGSKDKRAKWEVKEIK